MTSYFICIICGTKWGIDRADKILTTKCKEWGSTSCNGVGMKVSKEEYDTGEIKDK